MVALTPAELRARFETGLSDADLTAVITAENSVIEALYGPDATMSQTFDHRVTTGHHSYYEHLVPDRLYLARPAASITTITESVGETDTVLAADDYELVQRYQVRRKAGGTNSRYRWGSRVVVEYVPEDDSALRKQVLIKLCQLNLAENGYLITKTPEFTLQGIENYANVRAMTLRRLRKRPQLI